MADLEKDPVKQNVVDDCHWHPGTDITGTPNYQKPAIIYRKKLEAVAGVCDAEDPVNGKSGITCSHISS